MPSHAGTPPGGRAAAGRPLLVGGRISTSDADKPRGRCQAAILVNRQEDIVGHARTRHLMPLGEHVLGAAVLAVCGAALAVPCLRGVQWRRFAAAAHGREP